MSQASAASSRPVRKTIVASASDASSAGRLSVGSVIRFQSSAIAALGLAVRAQPVAERLLVERGVRRDRASRSAARRAQRASALARG